VKQYICPHCGKTVGFLKGRARPLLEEKICRTCGEKFMQKTNSQVYCSKECQKLDYKLEKAAKDLYYKKVSEWLESKERLKDENYSGAKRICRRSQ